MGVLKFNKRITLSELITRDTSVHYVYTICVYTRKKSLITKTAQRFCMHNGIRFGLIILARLAMSVSRRMPV